MVQIYQLLIDDLELYEAKKTQQFIIDAIDNGELEFPIQDCMTIMHVKDGVGTKIAD